MLLLKKLRARQSEQEQSAASAAAEYRSLVFDISSGKKVSPEKAEGILQAAGRTIAELESDVSIIVRRRKLAEDIAASKELQKASHEFAERRQEFMERRDRIHADLQAEAYALEAEAHARANIGNRANQARRHLRGLANLPSWLRVQQVELDAEREALQNRLGPRQNVSFQYENLDGSTVHVTGGNPSEAAELWADLERRQRELDAEKNIVE